MLSADEEFTEPAATAAASMVSAMGTDLWPATIYASQFGALHIHRSRCAPLGETR